MGRLLALVAIVVVVGTATIAALAAVFLRSDPERNTAAAASLLAGSIAAITGAVLLYRVSPRQ
jgi:hypothetical protein